jgi:hypothetical protein
VLAAGAAGEAATVGSGRVRDRAFPRNARVHIYGMSFHKGPDMRHHFFRYGEEGGMRGMSRSASGLRQVRSTVRGTHAMRCSQGRPRAVVPINQ